MKTLHLSEMILAIQGVVLRLAQSVPSDQNYYCTSTTGSIRPKLKYIRDVPELLSGRKFRPEQEIFWFRYPAGTRIIPAGFSKQYLSL